MTLTTTFIGNSDIKVSIELLNIKGQFATVKDGDKVYRCKIRNSFNGSKYILPFGSYSMAPAFTLPVSI